MSEAKAQHKKIPLKRLLTFGILREPNPNGGGNWKEKLSQFSRAMIAPVTLLAFAGLFLGIGSTIDKYQTSVPLHVFASILTSIGNIVFTLLPLLFAMAIAASFTNNSGSAVLTALIMYVAILMLSGAQFVTKTEGNTSYWSWWNVIDFEKVSRADMIVSTLGVQTLDISVFGGFIAGGLSVWIFNKFKDTRLPQVLSMFQGHRVPPIMAIIIGVPVSVVLALAWPWVSIGFVKFGQVSGDLPGGLDSFLFGFFERSLLPTGLHHMFYAPLLYTSAGGTVLPNYTLSIDVAIAGQTFVAGTPLYAIDASIFKPDPTQVIDTMPNVPGIQAATANNIQPIFGDRTIFQNINGTSVQFDWIEYMRSGGSDVGIHLGRFAAGKPAMMMFWIPAAGAAMVLAAPKKNMKSAFGVVLSASLTSFLTGITEPFEYTFLFAAPALFWGFHAVMAGVSYLTMNVAGVYYGPTFGGIIDLIIYGAIPQATGQSTSFYWVFVTGVAGAPIYFAVFYFSIRKWNLKTPGRADGEVALVTKEKYKAMKTADPLFDKAVAVFRGLGHSANISTITNCASRLRVTVKDAEAIDWAIVDQAKPYGVVGKGSKSVQIVFGPDVETIARIVMEFHENKRELPALPAPTK